MVRKCVMTETVYLMGEEVAELMVLIKLGKYLPVWRKE
jgi:hypothetical protein